MSDRIASARLASRRRRSGNATGSLVLLLLLLVGGGAWNYYRNWQIEKRTEGGRPYQSYAVEDLEALKAAYLEELGVARSDLEAARRRRIRPSGDRGTIAANVDQFQATARASGALREAAGNVVDRQSQVSQLERELELRTRFGEGLGRHFKRLTTL